MPGEITFHRKLHAALFAMERLLSSVHPSMTIEITLLRKLFAALVTGVGLCTGVCSIVNLKMGIARKRFITGGAGEQFAFRY
jgi:hypothetical protein